MEENLTQLLQLFDLADSLDKNFKTSLALDVIPNVICIGGAFFFHLGIYGALAIYSIGLVSGVANGMLPLLGQSIQKTKQPVSPDKPMDMFK
jgi:Cu2+-exporting ATPase